MNVLPISEVNPNAVRLSTRETFLERVLTGVGHDLEDSFTTRAIAAFEKDPSKNPKRLPVIASAIFDLTITAPVSFMKNCLRALRAQ